MNKTVFYKKATPLGGKLIREMIACMRSYGMDLPVKKPVILAVSGGPDSIALAHVLCHYGRRIVAIDKLSILYIDHKLREEADQEKAFVQDFAQKLGVVFYTESLEIKVDSLKGVSIEGYVRRLRKKIFQQAANKNKSWIFTAHHADDLAETVLWRLFTGKWLSHGQGIFFQHQAEIRPLLTVRKQVLFAYLQEVSQDYKIDMTNFNGQYLRSKMRMQLMPVIETLFPKAVEHLVGLTRSLQKKSLNSSVFMAYNENLVAMTTNFLSALGIRPSANQVENFVQLFKCSGNWYGEIGLQNGWKLVRKKEKSP